MSDKGYLGVKLLETNSQIAKKINTAIAEHLNKQISKNSKKVITKLKSAVHRLVAAQPEIASLRANTVAGSLGAQFGLTSATSDIVADTIISAVANSISYRINPIKNNLKGLN